MCIATRDGYRLDFAVFAAVVVVVVVVVVVFVAAAAAAVTCISISVVVIPGRRVNMVEDGLQLQR